MNATTGDVWMVGDRSHDVAAGRSAGATTIGVTWGFGSAAELIAAGVDRLVDSPDDIDASIFTG